MSNNLDELVERYIKLRDTKAALKKQFAEKMAPLEESLAQIEGIILKQFQENGVTSARTPNGTAYKSTRASATVADWDATLGHVIRNQTWGLLEKRVSKEAVQEFKDEYGELPPGVNWREEVTVNIRRS